MFKILCKIFLPLSFWSVWSVFGPVPSVGVGPECLFHLAAINDDSVQLARQSPISQKWNDFVLPKSVDYRKAKKSLLSLLFDPLLKMKFLLIVQKRFLQFYNTEPVKPQNWKKMLNHLLIFNSVDISMLFIRFVWYSSIHIQTCVYIRKQT